MTVVAQANDGRESIELFRLHRPDVAILDLRMPNIGGVEAIAAIRAQFPDLTSSCSLSTTLMKISTKG